MNVKLLRQIEREILKEPRRFDMYEWVRKGLTGKGAPPCGTTACIAGWATVLSKKDYPVGVETFKQQVDYLDGLEDYRFMYSYNAREALQITPGQARNLFFVGDWPEEYKMAYIQAKSARAKAKVAVARIEEFIKSKGRK